MSTLKWLAPRETHFPETLNAEGNIEGLGETKIEFPMHSLSHKLFLVESHTLTSSEKYNF